MRATYTSSAGSLCIAETRPQTRAREILIVEDDPACETVLRRTILSIDPRARISCEESAEQAIFELRRDELSGKTYDLIIADIFLTGHHTGLELWESCRERFPMTPVLITSGLPIHRFFETIGRNAVAPPYLAKPFQVGECKQ